MHDFGKLPLSEQQRCVAEITFGSRPCYLNPSGLGVTQQNWLRHPPNSRLSAGADAASLAEFMTGEDETFVLAKPGNLRFRRAVLLSTHSDANAAANIGAVHMIDRGDLVSSASQ